MSHLELQVSESELNYRMHLSDFLLERQDFLSSSRNIHRQLGYSGITPSNTKIALD